MAPVNSEQTFGSDVEIEVIYKITYVVISYLFFYYCCGGQNGIFKGYSATRALGLTKVPNVPLKQVAN